MVMKRKLEIKPVQIIAISFLSLILVGTLLLALPSSLRDKTAPLSFVDALFTATSAVCVTGLIVKDTATYFSTFGHGVIITLVQLGGLGIMVFSSLFLIVLGRRFTLSRKKILAADSLLELSGPRYFRRFIIFIVTSTFMIEIAASLVLFARWRTVLPYPPLKTFGISLFHCISAFCNAGFSLFSDSFTAFRGDFYTNAVIMLLVIVGGLGFIVLLDLTKTLFFKRRNHLFARLAVHTRLALVITVCLLVFGMAMIWILEGGYLFKTYAFSERLLASCFQSVTARTAGFNSIDIGALREPTSFFLMGLMFIGASPGGTGGGVKTTTLGVLILFFIALLRRKPQAVFLKRAISRHTFYKAACIFAGAIVWNAAAVLVLMVSERHSGIRGDYFLRCAFEVVSAFGTVGLTTGITPLLSPLGKCVIILTMFLGRIGPLSLALVVAADDTSAAIRYPKEKIAVG